MSNLGFLFLTSNNALQRNYETTVSRRKTKYLQEFNLYFLLHQKAHNLYCSFCHKNIYAHTFTT